MPKKFTTNETLTLLVSFAALLIAGAGFYLQHLHVSTGIDASLLEADPAGAELVYRFIVINHGNREAVVESASVRVSNDGVLTVANPFGQLATTPPLPVAVKAGSMAVISIEGPVSCEVLFGLGTEPDKDSGLVEFNGERTRKTVFALNAMVRDFLGDGYRITGGEITAYVTRTSIAGWHVDELLQVIGD